MTRIPLKRNSCQVSKLLTNSVEISVYVWKPVTAFSLPYMDLMKFPYVVLKAHTELLLSPYMYRTVYALKDMLIIAH